jgi:hypothetical protein
MFRPALVIWLSLAACGDSQEAKLANIRDQVCKCDTAGCAEVAMKQVPKEAVESNHRTQKLAREMIDCLAKLYAKPKVDTDGDGDSDDH